LQAMRAWIVISICICLALAKPAKHDASTSAKKKNVVEHGHVDHKQHHPASYLTDLEGPSFDLEKSIQAVKAHKLAKTAAKAHTVTGKLAHVAKGQKAAHKPIAHVPTHKAIAHKPLHTLSHKPVAHKLSTKPMAHKLVAHKPLAHKPLAHKPLAHKPSASKVAHKTALHKAIIHKTAKRVLKAEQDTTAMVVSDVETMKKDLQSAELTEEQRQEIIANLDRIVEETKTLTSQNVAARKVVAELEAKKVAAAAIAAAQAATAQAVAAPVADAQSASKADVKVEDKAEKHSRRHFED